MFSEVAYKNADACRFCWMCRHLCPISLKTGKEINSARARGLLVSLVKRGQEYDKTMAANMWECCLCGACTNDCATGYEPRTYIREGRSIAIAEGLAPKNVMDVVEKFLEFGNMYGKADLQAGLDLSGATEGAEVLLYIGEVASVEAPEIAAAAMSLLKKAGIAYNVLKNEPTSGAYMGDMIGFVEEVKQQGVALAKAIDASSAKTVVVLDPMDARIMKHEYKDWNCAPKAEVLTATTYFAQLVAEGKLAVTAGEGVCSIHDAGALSRDLDEDQPVRDLTAALGLKVEELLRCKDLAKATGGALLKQYDPFISAQIVEGRWEDLLRSDVRMLVTEAPGSYVALNSKVPEGCTLADILVLLDKASK